MAGHNPKRSHTVQVKTYRQIGSSGMNPHARREIETKPPGAARSQSIC